MQHNTFLHPARGKSRTPLVVRAAATVMALGVLTGTTLATAGSAAAHSALRETDPAQGSTVAVAPAQVRLTFNEDITAGFSAAALTVGGGAQQEAQIVEDGPVLSVTVPEQVMNQGAGQSWVVIYRVVSADGHPISGELPFTVAPAVSTAPSPTESASSEPQSSTSSPAQTPTDPAPTSAAADEAAAGTVTTRPAGSMTGTTVAIIGGVLVLVAAVVLAVITRRRRSR